MDYLMTKCPFCYCLSLRQFPMLGHIKMCIDAAWYLSHISSAMVDWIDLVTGRIFCGIWFLSRHQGKILHDVPFQIRLLFFNALTDIYSRNWPEKQHMFYAHPMVLCDTSYYGCKLSHRLNNKTHIAWS